MRPIDAPPVRDDFDSDTLSPSSISVRSRPRLSLTDRPSHLTLYARGASLDDPDIAFVGRRQQHHSCCVRAAVDPAGTGGLAVRLDERHHYEIELGDGKLRVLARVGSLRTTVATRPAEPACLRIDVVATPGDDWDPLAGPDTIRLGIERPDGEFEALAELDGRYLSTEVAGGFTGRVIGVYATAGSVAFDWFDYEPILGAP
jgi:hypothetical protein